MSFVTSAVIAILGCLLASQLAVIQNLHQQLKNIFFRKRRELEPPLVDGHWLWGSARSFGKNAVKFLRNTQQTHGDFFTVRMAHQHVTFVLDPCSIESLKNKNFDFDPVIKKVNKNCFGFELKNPKQAKFHMAHSASGAQMEQFLFSFDSILRDTLDRYEQPATSVDLRSFCGESLFVGLFGSIFGTEHHRNFNSKSLFNNLEVFHKAFNFLWLGFPVHFFPDAKNALQEMMDQPTGSELAQRTDASDYVKKVVENMAKDGQDLKGHNLSFIHVNYNMLKLTYWAIYYILKHPEAMSACLAEIQQLTAEPEMMDVGVPHHKLDSLPVLDSVIKEALRLCSGLLMARHVTEDTNMTSAQGKQYLIRQGDQIVYFSPVVHHNEQIFDKPEEFRFDRFMDSTFTYNGEQLKHPTLGFGTLCPGKRMAMLHIKWYMVVLLNGWSVSIQPGADYTSVDTSFYGNEILPPTNKVRIQLQRRQGAPNLRLVKN